MASSKPLNLKTISKKICNITKDPEIFLSFHSKRSEDIKKLVKYTYDFTVQRDFINEKKNEILSELIIDDLDGEQIWQQLEIRNDGIWADIVENTSKLLASKNHIFVLPLNTNNEDTGSESNLQAENEKKEETKNFDLLQVNKSAIKLKNLKIKPSVVDDNFFKLSEMEMFLNEQDEKEMQKHKSGENNDDEEEIDYFNDHSSTEDNVDDYNDFFDDENLESEQPSEFNQNDLKKHKNEEFEEENSETDIDGSKDLNNKQLSCSSSESDNDNSKSNFEVKQERLQQRIKQYEEEVLGEKPWQLKGEISGSVRPQNSLLEEILEFDSTNRPAPIITEETTERLEDIIRQRIKNSLWDDVERKKKPVITPQEYRKTLVLNQEKSKESLVQIYEKEYHSEIEKLNAVPLNGKENIESKIQKEIKSLMSSLFIKLDALSNFHFAPKPIAPETKIITNVSTINMEEVAPLAVTNSQLLAPEEIMKHSKGNLIGTSERTQTDKNRERRNKKLHQRAVHKSLSDREIQKQKLGIKNSTNKADNHRLLKQVTKNRNISKVNESTNCPLKSSKSFFSQLQQNQTTKPRKQKNSSDNNINAKKFKL